MNKVIGLAKFDPSILCPSCGKGSKKIVVREGIRTPEEGDLMFHRACRTWVRIVPDGLRLATRDEIDEWKIRHGE